MTGRFLAGGVMALSLAACAHGYGRAPIPDSALQTHPGGDIVTAGAREVRIALDAGCLYLVQENRRYVAFFPEGTTISSDRLSLRLPDGSELETGRRYRLSLEYWPVLANANPACGEGTNAYVRSLARDD